MSIKICTAEHMISSPGGIGMARGWFPRIVAERFVGTTRDVTVERAPDPVTFIETDMTWYNGSADAQHVSVSIHRAPQSITTSNPNKVLITDAWSSDVGISPSAGVPEVSGDGLAGRLKLNRPSDLDENIVYGRLFIDADDHVGYAHIGSVPPGQAMHFRYVCAVQTPGDWRLAVDPRHEAATRWVRLIAIASPMVTGI